jgi:O-antigen biosynthesis protein
MTWRTCRKRWQQSKELFSYHGEQFVFCAYGAILGRLPDKAGLNSYLRRMRAGRGKLAIVIMLAWSSEGRAKRSHVSGLAPFAPGLIFVISALNRIQRVEAVVPPSFDPIWYLQEYADVVGARTTPYFHYRTQGVVEGRSPAFDDTWYRTEYADSLVSGLDAKAHYETIGRAHHFFPSLEAGWYLEKYPEAANSRLNATEHYRTRGKSKGYFPSYSGGCARNDYKKWIAMFDTLTDATRSKISAVCDTHSNTPRISIIVLLSRNSPKRLEKAIASVVRQIYPRWELFIRADDSIDLTTKSLVERYANSDDRVHVEYHEQNRNWAVGMNRAISDANGNWITILRDQDCLSENALFWAMEAIEANPQLCLVYADDDQISGEPETRSSPHFKCDWNKDLFYSSGYISNFVVYRRSLVLEVGAFRPIMEDACEYDLLLRCTEKTAAAHILHIPRILYHRHLYDPQSVTKVNLGGVSALNDHLRRLQINATAIISGNCYRVRYGVESEPSVTLIIPTRNRVELLRQCVESILSKTTYQRYEIMIVDNGSDDKAALEYLSELRFRDRIIIKRDDRPFNYSMLNNSAVREARGQIVGLVNNDIEVISADWLSEMVSHVLRPEVGVVGAKLWYPNDTLQHGGIILGIEGIAGHAHRYLAKGEDGYMRRASCVQSLSAVTGACLVMRKSTYEALGGLNEHDLPVACNDVDLCLRARKAGYSVIWTPHAELYHHESASRGIEDTDVKRRRARKEVTYMRRKWSSDLEYDPAYSPNLTIQTEDFSLAWPSRVAGV